MATALWLNLTVLTARTTPPTAAAAAARRLRLRRVTAVRHLSHTSTAPLHLRPIAALTPTTTAAAAVTGMEKSRAQIYAQWSQTELIARILDLERGAETPKPVQPRKPKKSFDSTRYSTRHIALKLAYLGANYGGFEYHANNPFSTPTVEEQIFKALLKARLVPHNGLPGEEETVQGWPGDEEVEYSKCGRTDKGVSAFGQVISVRVRSNRPLLPPKPSPSSPAAAASEATPELLADGFGGALQDQSDGEDPPFNDTADELPYPQILNRLLPPDIRVLAWCPAPPPGFSARFSCEERRYRYYFTNPPIPSPAGAEAATLDIRAMREAARLFVGDHDFRNFCKLDASKQISRFDRIINHADIVEVDAVPSTSSTSSSATTHKLYYLTLHGSAFLWHQVRHMVALLFLIGQRLESPSLISALLDTATNPRKPMYEMASDHPLALWDCVYPRGMLQWVYVPTAAGAAAGGGKEDPGETVWALWHRARMQEVLCGGLLDVIAEGAAEGGGGSGGGAVRKVGGGSQVIVDGGHEPVYRGRYVPVLDRKRMEAAEVINKRYVEKKGDWKENRDRRVQARKDKALSMAREEGA